MRWRIGVLLAGIAVIAVAGYAVGAGKSSDNLVLCATKKGGDLSLAGKGNKCGKGEKKLTLSRKGPQGPVGPQGATGPAGSAGSPANMASEPITYVSGPSNDECFAKPGTFCKATGGTVHWTNFSSFDPDYGRVGYYKDASGFVHLTGAAYDDSSGGISGPFVPRGPFYLPPGYRPSVIEVFTVPAVAPSTGTTFNSAAIVEVEPDGEVVVGESDIVGLSGVVFRP